MSKINPVQKYGVAGIADVLSCFGIPTAVASQLYQDILEKRNAEALEILLSEIRQGNFENIDQQDVISIVARFQRDAMEGVARNNLRLMANVLASLSEDEITVLGIMAKYAQNPDLRDEGRKHPLDIIDREKDELKSSVAHYAVVQQALVRTGLVFFSVSSQYVSDEDLNEVIPQPRQGQVAMLNPVNYFLTPLMNEILKYADFLLRPERG
jgi:hypothetical protein